MTSGIIEILTDSAAVQTLVWQNQAADKYKVRRGDTLSKVARQFGTTIQELMERNNLKKTAIYVGQMLLVN